LAQIRLAFSRKTQETHTLISKNDATELKARLLKQPVKKMLTG